MASIPFLAAHAVAVATPFVAPFAWRWLALAAATYAIRLFAITAGYHRYFAHRAYRTSRAFQLVLAVVGVKGVEDVVADVLQGPGRVRAERGRRLTGVGARIVAETLHRAMEGSRHSIVREPDWRPTLGPVANRFTMPDLLLIAYDNDKDVLAPLGD